MNGAAGSGAVAVVVVRRGGLPAGADEAVAEAEGNVLLVGTNPSAAVPELVSARRVWWSATGTSQVGLSRAVADTVSGADLVILPSSPDGRDLAPRLAAVLDRPLLAGAVSVGRRDGRVEAELLRVDGRVVIPVSVDGAVVATLWPAARASAPTGRPPVVAEIELPLTASTGQGGGPAGAELERLGLIEPDPATMDLADARRVLGGGAGLVPAGAGPVKARAIFELLAAVAARLGASAGATRVVTDAGWMPYDRQIGTTGVAVDPDLYIALGVSGASQHVGGLGSPDHTVSVNLDGSCPMTASADLGLVADAPALLLELARRLGVDVPAALDEVAVRS